MFSKKKITTVEKLEKSKAFCIKPWVHLFISQKGTVGPCCLASWEKEETFGDVNEQTIEEIWNGTEMQKFRKTLMVDKKDARCWQCYENEENGLQSKRNVVNFLYADYLHWVKDTSRKGVAKSSKPIYWDIRISNLCNLKCRICGHHSSSSWHEDSKALKTTSYNTKIHKGPERF